ncbi:MAG: polysaccharide export outer membrane protein [Elusimicrobia bacterium]|nr:MAG: polysaccharide export outer membrane protein [Elusimicrobiota bacterium]KAF0157012.1 MAG: polysaccharide export outer membrane protein [Elusimicrobiota bacterium]
MKRLAAALVIFLNTFPAGLCAQGLSLVTPGAHYVSPGDVISVNVFPAEEFSREVTVQPDGTIEVPLLGSLKVQGMKADELQNILTARFSKYVSNPSITVNVRKFSSYRVAIIGQVRNPGYFEYREGMKLLELVAQSGGLQDYARTGDLRVFRSVKVADGGVKEEVFEARLDEVFDGVMDKNISLKPGDVVYVPRKKLASTTKWLSDNLLPWLMLGTFALSMHLATDGR